MKSFTVKYQKWCKKHGYNFSEDKALDIYASACEHVGVMPKTRTLFLVMGVILQNAPDDGLVYQFMDRKRAEGKPYKVYMMASANKFLRIYYASVKAHLDSLKTD